MRLAQNRPKTSREPSTLFAILSNLLLAASAGVKGRASAGDDATKKVGGGMCPLSSAKIRSSDDEGRNRGISFTKIASVTDSDEGYASRSPRLRQPEPPPPLAPPLPAEQ